MGGSKAAIQACLTLVVALVGALFTIKSSTLVARAMESRNPYDIALLVGVTASVLFVFLLGFRPAAALVVFIVSLPIVSRLKQLVSIDLSYVFISIESALILVLAMTVLVRLLTTKTRLPVTKEFKAYLGVFLLFMIIATLASTHLAESTSTLIEGYLLPCLLFFITLSYVRTLKQFEWVVWALIVSAAIASGYGLSQFLTYGSGYRIVSAYYSPDILAVILVSTLPLPLAAAMYHHNFWLRGISIVILVEICLALILTETRGVIIALMVALLGFLLLTKPTIRFVAWAVLALVLLVPFRIDIQNALSNRPAFDVSFDFTSSNLERWLGAQSSVAMIRDHPLGIGPGMFVHYYPQYILPEAVRYLEDAHNLFLNVFVEGGFGAGIFFMLLFVETLRRSFASVRLKRSRLHPIAMAILASLVLFGITELTTGEQFVHRHMANVAYIFWILAALAMIVHYRGESFDSCVFDTPMAFSANERSLSHEAQKTPSAAVPGRH